MLMSPFKETHLKALDFTIKNRISWEKKGDYPPVN
jgi:hypothetical protein